MSWQKAGDLPSKDFVCGYCNKHVASDKGFLSFKSKHTGQRSYDDMYSINQGSFDNKYSVKQHSIYLCPDCDKPNIFFENGSRIPDEYPGKSVENLPDDIGKIYEEMRQCISASCYIAAVMLGRKLLMHIAVDKGAEQNKKFIEYVDYLGDNGYTPAHSKNWIDHIRKQGNEANHKIILKGKDDAIELIDFIEMLAKLIYEYPARASRSLSSNEDG